MKTEKTLYLVYSPEFDQITPHVHLSDAIAEAKKFAGDNPTYVYYVMKSITGFCTAAPEVQELQFRDTPDNGIPAITNLIKESRRENS